MSQPNIKTQLDTANSAIKLLQVLLDRADRWRYGQRLVAGAALVSVAAALALGVSDPRYTAAAVFLVMGVSFLTKERQFVTARHIAVKDSKGRFRAVMTGADDEPMVGLVDASGEVRLHCGLNADGVPTIGQGRSAAISYRRPDESCSNAERQQEQRTHSSVDYRREGQRNGFCERRRAAAFATWRR